MTTKDTTAPVRVSRWRPLRWITFAVVAVVIAVGAAFGSRLGKDPTLVDTPLIGKPAPTTTVADLEGNGSVSLGDLRGQVVVVNFWASWCEACRQEHPALLAAATTYRSAGVMFIGVDYQDQHDAAIGFLDAMGRGDPSAYRYVTDPDSTLAMDFGVFGVPETYFLDRNETIRAKITGAATYQQLSAVLDQIVAG